MKPSELRALLRWPWFLKPFLGPTYRFTWPSLNQLSYPVGGTQPELRELTAHLNFLPQFPVNSMHLYLTFHLCVQYLPRAENCPQHFLNVTVAHVHGWYQQRAQQTSPRQVISEGIQARWLQVFAELVPKNLQIWGLPINAFANQCFLANVKTCSEWACLNFPKWKRCKRLYCYDKLEVKTFLVDENILSHCCLVLVTQPNAFV